MTHVSRVSPHIVVPDAAVAAEWYVQAFGARERNRIPRPGGAVMAVELDFGTTTVHVGSEFALSLGWCRRSRSGAPPLFCKLRRMTPTHSELALSARVRTSVIH
jgi:hypothetical protein